MNPDEIELQNLSKSFEYFKFASEIDNIDDIKSLKNIAKSYFKLYLKQQEVLSSLTVFNPDFINWDYNDYNALFGNVDIPQFSNIFMDVDYGTGIITPQNFDDLTLGIAIPAAVQDSNYSSAAWSNIRYNGSRVSSYDFNRPFILS
jgi:hypothetical protein